ncbi:MAG: thermonuclease family protein [Candidatus Nanoarchaeia archaeon]
MRKKQDKKRHRNKQITKKNNATNLERDRLTALAISCFLVLIITITLFLLFYEIKGYGDKKYYSSISPNTVTRVIDGDTFELATGEKIRLICIDAPEIKSKGGEESKLFLESIILGKEIRLEKDITDKDAYGRLLRYVWINITTESPSTSLGDSQGSMMMQWKTYSTKEILVNKEMVANGYAQVFRYGNDTKRCSEIEEP